MKIVAGLLRPDSGKVYLDGIEQKENIKEFKERIGYMPDFFGVYDNLKAMEYMEFYASIYGIEGEQARKLGLELIDLVGLADKADTYVDSLSRGMKQRLCLARSLIHNPEFLILDEPASGLDPRARYDMKEIIKELNKRGKTILISSHILPELAQMCTNIGIIENGKMMVTGTVEEIMATRGTASPLVMRFTDGQEKGIEVLQKNKLVDNVTIKNNSVSILFKGNEEEEAVLLSDMIKNGAYVSYFSREESDLESLFIQITDHTDPESNEV